MKKNLLTLSALLLAGLSFGQVVMSENFDAGTALPAGWAVYNVDGLTPASSVNYVNAAWVGRANSVTGTGNHMVSTSWYTPAGVSNDWLVSPSIAVPASGSYFAQFKAMAPDANFPDGFKVYISTTGNQVSDFSSPAVLTVPAAPATYTSYSIDLAAYAGQNIYFAIQNNSNDKFLLFFDEFVVRQPAANDALLNSATLNRYSLTNTNNQLSLSVKNDGSNPITSLTINWNDGTDHSQVISGLNIAPGASANVNHPTQVNYATAVERSLAVTITNVNGTTDPNMSNNATTKLINTVSAIEEKSVVIEEGTGTWCVWCPRGAVAMDYMVNTYPNDFIGIAVHNGDPMTVTAYDAGADFSGYPGANVDRALLDQSVSQSAFVSYYNARKDLIVPAGVTVAASGAGSNVTINASATFRTPFAAANYRLGVIIVEDGVTGTTSGYNQANAYAGGANGVMGGYESLPNPVPAAQMVYNHVGRALLGGYTGQTGSVPTTITDGQTVSYTFNYTVPATSNKAKMHAVAVLIDQTTGEIVNAAQGALSAASLGEMETIGMEVYPNPASDVVNVKFEGNGGDYQVVITDLSGRQVAATAVVNANGAQAVTLPIAELSAGNYLVTIAKEGASYTQNLIVK